MGKPVHALSSAVATTKAALVFNVSLGSAESDAASIAELIGATGLGVIAVLPSPPNEHEPLFQLLKRKFELPVSFDYAAELPTSCEPGSVVIAFNTKAEDTVVTDTDEAFMQAPIAMTVTDQNGIIHRANMQMAALTGYTVEELNGRFVGVLFSEEILAQIAERHKQVIEQGSDEPALFSLLRKDGEVRIVAIASRLYRTESGLDLKITTLRDQSLEYASDIVNLMLLRQDLGLDYSIPKPSRVFVSGTSTERVDGVLSVRAHAIWDLDLKRNHLYRSEGFQIQFGMPSGSYDYTLGEHNPHVHPEDQQLVAASFKAFLTNSDENYWQLEYRHGVIDGKYQTVLDAAYAFRDATGAPYRVIGVSHNVTQRRRLEKLQSQASELSRNGSWDITMPDLKLYWSPEVFSIHEVDGDTPPPIEDGINFYKEGWARELIKERVELAMRTGEGWDLELPIITAKGNERWIRTIGKPVLKDGVCVSLSGSFQDIDERKRIQLDLSESNERFILIADVTNEAIYDWNIKTGELYWGRGFATVFGYDPEVHAPTIDTWSDLMHPDDHKRVSDSLNAAIMNPLVDRWFEEYRYRTSDGSYLYCLDQGGFVRDDNGQAIRMVGSVQDISASKAFEEALLALNRQLAQQAQQLETSNKDLEQFAYVASHDLREPLRMVSSFLTQIERKYGNQLDERGREYIGFAVDGAQRMKQIIHDLLNYARITRFDEPVSRIDLNELLTDVLNLHRATIDECNAKITMEELPIVYSYKTPWAQILNNLIGNALKYRKPNAPLQIDVHCALNSDHFSLSVSDTGIGIDQEHYERIFGIFQRLHKQNDYPGTGIGLSLVKKITENFGGKISVVSEKNQGSTFTLIFPNTHLTSTQTLA